MALLALVTFVACGGDVHPSVQVTPTTKAAQHGPPKEMGVVRPTHARADVDLDVRGYSARLRMVNVARLRAAQWVLAVAEDEAERKAQVAAVVRAGAVHAPSLANPVATSGNYNATGSVNGYPCGGDLPSCCTLRAESGGQPTAQNPTSSSSGLWQFLDSTWAGYGGYTHAAYAPADVQNERARQVFNGGRGASSWYGDGCYGGR